MKILKNIFRKALLVGIVILSFNQNANAQDVDYKAYSLFIYNFIKYIEWPADNSTQFVIGVAGDSPIVKELNALAATKKAHGKTIVIKIINVAADAAKCDLLYVPDGKSKFIKEYLLAINKKSVLVVSEREGMAKKGAGINFILDDNENLKFEVSKATLTKQNLKIPTVLLNLGYVVD